MLADKLNAAQLGDADDAVLIQSFEESALRKMDTLVENKLVYVISDSALTDGELAEYATWLHAVSYNKNLIIPREDDGSLGEPPTVVDDAHEVGLDVHSWTFRNENHFLPTDLREGDYPPDWGNYQEGYRLFLETGIDALFSDFPDASHTPGKRLLTAEPSQTPTTLSDPVQRTAAPLGPMSSLRQIPRPSEAQTIRRPGVRPRNGES